MARRTRRTLAALILGGLAGTLTNSALPAQAAELGFTVTSLADAPDPSPGDGLCQAADGSCTLRAALGAGDGKSPVTITLTAGTIALTAGPLVVTGDAPVTVTGAGRDVTLIDARAGERALDLTGGALTLSGLTIRGGVNPLSGGAAIATRQTDLTLRQVTVTASAADGDGGAILMSDGALRVDDSDFTGNGGTFGGAVAALDADVEITNSRFTGNGTSGGGGALFLSHLKSLSITGTTFEDNTASGQGGAVYLEGFRGAPSSPPRISATFARNSALGDGGALFVRTTSDGLSDVTLTLAGSRFTANQAPAGGAVAADAGRLAVEETTFGTNRATTGAGGAIAAAGRLAVSRSTFEGNEAAETGGAIASVGPFQVEGTTFSGNRSGSLGGALALTGVAGPEVRSSRFDGNVAESGAGAVWRSGAGLAEEGNTYSGNQPAGADVKIDTGAPAFSGGGADSGLAGDAESAVGKVAAVAGIGLLLAAAVVFVCRRRSNPFGRRIFSAAESIARRTGKSRPDAAPGPDDDEHTSDDEHTKVGAP